MDRLFKRRKKEITRKQRFMALRYAAADTGRLLSSWTTTNTSADADIASYLKSLRARSRQLVKDNDYALRFMQLAVNNIIGSTGISFQCKSKDAPDRLDKRANDIIETGFADWGRPVFCSLDGQLSWKEMQRLILQSAIQDGEVLVRIYRGNAVNKYSFALQVLEADHLEIDLTDTTKNIQMGIEYDGFGRPVAYHLYKQHPGGNRYAESAYGSRERVDAKDILHIFLKERPSQSRGVPWMHSAMVRLNHLGSYEEAEIVAARVAACKMGILTNPNGEGYVGDEKDTDNNIVVDVGPGNWDQLPAGWDVKMFDPTHPAGNFDGFMKRTLMGIASGLGVSYVSLANDLSAVNYSSIRAGSLAERDHWRMLQSWFIESFCVRVFERWLDGALITQAIKLPYERIEKYNKPRFYARSWDWVDPEKDTNAAIKEINAGLNTLTDVLAESGKDIEDIIETKKQEQELLAQYGITLNTDPQNPAKQKLENSDGNQTANQE
jgi:lambda family phage portal protein